ncbi:MAG: hypothetical protein EBQ87_12950 [Planctomycetes bacterium]|nr:hypothetical protein [Planctomycetota bacterium]
MHLITALCLLSIAVTQPNPLDVSIKNLDGKAAKLADHAGSKATVVVFMQFECPISSEYSTELARLSTLYGSKGVNFVGVIPNADEDAALKKDARDYKIGFPVLHDAKLVLVDALGAKLPLRFFFWTKKVRLFIPEGLMIPGQNACVGMLLPRKKILLMRLNLILRTKWCR